MLLKYQNIKIFFGKGYISNWSEKAFVIKQVKNTVWWTYVINDLKEEKIVGKFYEIELQKTNRKQFFEI